ncbi:hypothetical protein BH11PAT2_BH11PAT2_07990 [soil metagenome]
MKAQELTTLVGGIAKTVNTLVVAVNDLVDGFQTLGRKVEALDGKVDTLGGRFEALDAKVDTLGGRFGALDGKVDILSGRFETLDGKVETLSIDMKEGFVQADSRIDDLAGMMANEFRGIDERFDAVDDRLEVVESGNATIVLKVDAMRSDVGSLVFDTDKTKNRIEKLEIKSFGAAQAA